MEGRVSDQLSATLPNDATPVAASKNNKLRLLIRAMRPYQWSKNLFVLTPLLFAKKVLDPHALEYSLIAFIVFCFLASGLYIFNDWLDIEEDRAHPLKRDRPLSSGALPVSIALAFSAILVFVALGLASFLSHQFLFIATVYFGLTLLYCLTLKRFIILDCLTIASGFVLRVVGGAVAISVEATHWLIACAFLLALFLAFSKRRQELLTLSNKAVGHRKVLGEYSVSFLERANIIVIGATIVSYALYTVAPETTVKFQTNALIYGTVFVIYGLLRYLALIDQSENGGDPSKMLLRDRPLLITVALWAVYNAAIVYHTVLFGDRTFLF